MLPNNNLSFEVFKSIVRACIHLYFFLKITLITINDLSWLLLKVTTLRYIIKIMKILMTLQLSGLTDNTQPLHGQQ